MARPDTPACSSADADAAHAFDSGCWWIRADAPTPATPQAAAGHALLFRRRFDAPVGARLTVHVSADAAYVLFLNGEPVGRGPAFGDIRHQFFETFDLSDRLRPGRNALCALVTGFASAWPDYGAGGPPVFRMCAVDALVLSGTVTDAGGAPMVSLASDRQWRAVWADELRLLRQPGVPCAGPREAIRLTERLARWTRPDFDDADWPAARELVPPAAAARDNDSPFPHRLTPRSIPPLRETHLHAGAPFDVEGLDADALGQTLEGGDWLPVPAGTAAEFHLDHGALTTAFPLLATRGGHGARIELVYAERLTGPNGFVRDPAQPHAPLDPATCMTDSIDVAAAEATWMPHTWRAFRFLRIRVRTAAEPLLLRLGGVLETTYPFHMRGAFASDDEELDRVGAISRRTLELCSHETFEDCPYFERLQYAGDVQVEAAIAYWSSGDTALARQAVRHFSWSSDFEGLTASRYPSRVPQRIPLWTLHWIATLHEYYLYTGDLALASETADTVRGALTWFLRRRTASGLLGPLPYWGVADWCPQWEGGLPPGIKKTESAMPNFLFIACLRTAATLFAALGDDGEARVYADLAEHMAAEANRRFWCPQAGLFRDRADADTLSQLTNAWAILSRAASLGQQRSIAEQILDRDGLCQAAWFGRYFVFQALLAANAPGQAARVLDIFREIPRQGFTTCPESLYDDLRSECHAWSAMPAVALPQLYLGVRLLAPGGSRLLVAPWRGTLRTACGTVPLPAGNLRVDWQCTPGPESTFRLQLNVPEGSIAEVRLPDGSVQVALAGASTHSCPA